VIHVRSVRASSEANNGKPLADPSAIAERHFSSYCSDLIKLSTKV